jgi:hypothetical protein
MAERRKRITKKLDELHEHINTGEPIDSEIEQPLQQAIGDVQQAIDPQSEAEEDHTILT